MRSAKYDSPEEAEKRNKLKRSINEVMTTEDLNNYKLGWRKTKPLTDEEMESILLALANGMAVTTIAEEIHSSVLAIQRQRVLNKNFNIAYNEALGLRKILLEEKAFSLAFTGEKVIVTKGQGENKYTEERIEYPAAALLQFMLKAYVPDKFGIDRHETKVGPLETPPEIVRNEADRYKLLKKLQEIRAKKQLEADTAIDVPFVEVIEKAESVEEDLSDFQ